MSQNDTPDYTFDIFYLLRLILRWKWPIMIISILGALTTYLFTGPRFMKPEYMASVIFYPTTNASISTTLLTEPGMARYSLLEFGSDQDAEQILQILKSDELKNAVIRKFNLAKHYGVDTTNGVSLYTLQNLLSKQMNVKQTEFKAIQVSVYDTDPQLAADMANFISNHADALKTGVQKLKAKDALDILSQEYLAQKAIMDSIDKSLMSLRKKGIYDYFGQASQLNEAYAENRVRFDQESAMLKVYEENKSALPDSLIIRSKARVKGYEAAIKNIKPQLDAIKDYGGIYVDNVNNLEIERKKLSTLKMRYESAKLDFERSLPQKFLINAAVKPEIPSTPRRMLLTGVAFLSGLALSILVIILMDLYPVLKRRLN
jgi:uncharacterized protein involved in exopolysaccharide biosynthesis